MHATEDEISGLFDGDFHSNWILSPKLLKLGIFRDIAVVFLVFCDLVEETLQKMAISMMF